MTQPKSLNALSRPSTLVSAFVLGMVAPSGAVILLGDLENADLFTSYLIPLILFEAVCITAFILSMRGPPRIRQRVAVAFIVALGLLLAVDTVVDGFLLFSAARPGDLAKGDRWLNLLFFGAAAISVVRMIAAARASD